MTLVMQRGSETLERCYLSVEQAARGLNKWRGEGFSATALKHGPGDRSTKTLQDVQQYAAYLGGYEDLSWRAQFTPEELAAAGL